LKDLLRTPIVLKAVIREDLLLKKILDKDHVIRIIYVENDESLRIITMYPGRRKRYEKN